MHSTLPNDLQQFVEDIVASGKFRSPDEVLAEGLRILRERERKLDSLRADLQIGLDQLDRSEGIVVDGEESHRQLFDSIRTRGLARLAVQPETP